VNFHPRTGAYGGHLALSDVGIGRLIPLKCACRRAYGIPSKVFATLA